LHESVDALFVILACGGDIGQQRLVFRFGYGLLQPRDLPHEGVESLVGGRDPGLVFFPGEIEHLHPDGQKQTGQFRGGRFQLAGGSGPGRLIGGHGLGHSAGHVFPELSELVEDGSSGFPEHLGRLLPRHHGPVKAVHGGCIVRQGACDTVQAFQLAGIAQPFFELLGFVLELGQIGADRCQVFILKGIGVLQHEESRLIEVIRDILGFLLQPGPAHDA